MDHSTLLMGEAEVVEAKRLSQQPPGPPGLVLGYEAERLLGQGAFGQVWLARDRNTGRKVAIKFFLHRGGLDWLLLSREVEKLSFLFNDRHVVQLLEVGWESDPPYYIMEYLRHGSLEGLLKREGRLPVREAVQLIHEVAIGLIHAHGKGILHCDLKPANILLDEDGRPRLADFGQSRLAHDQHPALGTLFYMAPEQADLTAAPDVRWDVYALGAVFFHLLTGHPPFRPAEQVMGFMEGSGLEKRLERYRKLIADSPRPSEHRRVQGVDRTLADIIDRCLAADPRARFANVQAVLDALDFWASKRARRPWMLLGALAPAVVFLLSAGFAWKGIAMTVAQSKEALVARSLESNYFAARFVADRFALEIDKRWRILEHEADDDAFRGRLGKICKLTVNSAGYKNLQAALQSWLDEQFGHYQGQFRPGLEASSWLVTDRRGIQIARAPHNQKTVNQNWSHRDYFHGQGPVSEERRAARQPIRQPHRSVVFRSQARHTLMVAFSVPIWGLDEDRKVPVGVLSMTVELGNFLERTWSRDQFVALIDTLPDAGQHRPGLVIEHPYLDDKKGEQTASVPMFFASANFLRRAERLRQLRVDEWQQHLQQKLRGHSQERLQRHPKDQDFPGDYMDPVAGYDGGWLATVEPVMLLHGRQLRDTGWVVVIQKRFDAAVGPISALQARLIYLGLWALGIVVIVVSALWVLAIFVLKKEPVSRLLVAFRGWIGSSNWSGRIQSIRNPAGSAITSAGGDKKNVEGT